MNPKVEFLFDYASPFSYLANLQIEGFAKRNGAAVGIARIIGKRRVLATTLMADIERQEVKDRLRQNTDRAVKRGVFGAPTFFVGSEMFWGNDRIDIVEEALRKQV